MLQYMFLSVTITTSSSSLPQMPLSCHIIARDSRCESYAMHSGMDISVTIQDGGLAISTKLWAHKIHSQRFNKILVLHNWNHNETTFLLLADRSGQKLKFVECRSEMLNTFVLGNDVTMPMGNRL